MFFLLFVDLFFDFSFVFFTNHGPALCGRCVGGQMGAGEGGEEAVCAEVEAGDRWREVRIWVPTLATSTDRGRFLITFLSKKN